MRSRTWLVPACFSIWFLRARLSDRMAAGFPPDFSDRRPPHRLPSSRSSSAVSEWVLPAGARADRHPRPLLFMPAEMIVALSAAATSASPCSRRGHLYRQRRIGTPGLDTASAVRLTLSVLVLAVPRIAMGGTLPAAARWRHAGHRRPAPGCRGAVRVNTLGLVAGCSCDVLAPRAVRHARDAVGCRASTCSSPCSRVKRPLLARLRITPTLSTLEPRTFELGTCFLRVSALPSSLCVFSDELVCTGCSRRCRRLRLHLRLCSRSRSSAIGIGGLLYSLIAGTSLRRWPDSRGAALLKHAVAATYALGESYCAARARAAAVAVGWIRFDGSGLDVGDIDCRLPPALRGRYPVSAAPSHSSDRGAIDSAGRSATHTRQHIGAIAGSSPAASASCRGCQRRERGGGHRHAAALGAAAALLQYAFLAGIGLAPLAQSPSVRA